MFEKFKNEQGASLVLVIIVFMVASILATTIISVSSEETEQLIETDQKIQAELVALSGIEIMKEYITNQYTTDFKQEYVNNNFPIDITIEEGIATINIEFFDSDMNLLDYSDVVNSGNLDDDSYKYIRIISEGKFKNESNIKKAVVKNTIDTEDHIFPAFHTFPKDGGNNIKPGQEDHPVRNNYNPVTLPSIDNDKDKIHIGESGYETESIMPNGDINEYKQIKIGKNGELTINLNYTNTENIEKIVVEKLTVKDGGYIDIQGEGMLVIYVTNKVSLTSLYNSSLPEKLLFVLDGNASFDLTLEHNKDFNGYIYAPEDNSSVTINGANNAKFNGAIVSYFFTNTANYGYKGFSETSKLENIIEWDKTYNYEFERYEVD